MKSGSFLSVLAAIVFACQITHANPSESVIENGRACLLAVGQGVVAGLTGKASQAPASEQDKYRIFIRNAKASAETSISLFKEQCKEAEEVVHCEILRLAEKTKVLQKHYGVKVTTEGIDECFYLSLLELGAKYPKSILGE